MESEERDRLQRRVEDEVKSRFPPGAVRRVALLKHGDEPVVEPGELLVRVFVEPPPPGPEGSEPMETFGGTHRKAMRKLASDLSQLLPDAGRLQFMHDAPDGPDGQIMIRPPTTHAEGERAGGELTPVMARLARSTSKR